MRIVLPLVNQQCRDYLWINVSIYSSFRTSWTNVHISTLQLRAKKNLEASNNDLENNLDNAQKVRGAISVSLFIWTWCSFATDLSFTLKEWDWYSLPFVLTCRLTENYRKIRRSCNNKWRCVFLTVLQCLLVQTFCISLSSSGFLVSSGTIWYVIYETRKIVFDHNYKHREDSTNDYMKDNKFQLRRKISRHDWSSQLCTQNLGSLQN